MSIKKEPRHFVCREPTCQACSALEESKKEIEFMRKEIESRGKMIEKLMAIKGNYEQELIKQDAVLMALKQLKIDMDEKDLEIVRLTDQLGTVIGDERSPIEDPKSPISPPQEEKKKAETIQTILKEEAPPIEKRSELIAQNLQLSSSEKSAENKKTKFGVYTFGNTERSEKGKTSKKVAKPTISVQSGSGRAHVSK